MKILVNLTTLVMLIGSANVSAATAIDSYSANPRFEGRATMESGKNSEKATLPGGMVPKDTKIPIVMDTPLNSNTCVDGEQFTCRIGEDLTVDGSTVIPTGSLLKGKIVLLRDSKQYHTAIVLKLETITISGNREVPISGELMQKGGFVNVRRGTAAIAINSCNSPLQEIAGAQICTWASNAHKKLEFSTPNKVKQPIASESFNWPPGSSVALVAKNGCAVDIKAGDELKIELTQDLGIPVDDE